jgi:hypothetical protein
VWGADGQSRLGLGAGPHRLGPGCARAAARARSAGTSAASVRGAACVSSGLQGSPAPPNLQGNGGPEGSGRRRAASGGGARSAGGPR